jgi:CarD family transcriptional regulator
MTAQKKANKKSSRSVAKKSKPAAGATSPRKRKPSAASRSSRAVVKSKSRPAKAKSAKRASARRPGASAKTTKAPKGATTKSRAGRASARTAHATATKPEKPVDTKLQSSEDQAREAAKTKAASASETKGAPAASAKASAPPPAKRAPVAPKAGKSESVERDDEASASKAAKSASPRQGFKLNEFVVYPAHGVGQIVAIEDQEVAGFRLELFVINFAKDKMTLRVPTSKVVGVGMRKLSEPDVAKRSLDILTGRARVKRTMWSRRAQEYEAKINSGDINAIAEVVRDLYRSDAQPEQSYSERQLYEAALDRMMREIAAVQKLSEMDAFKVIEAQLKKSQRRAAKGETVEGDEGAIEEAA